MSRTKERACRKLGTLRDVSEQRYSRMKRFCSVFRSAPRVKSECDQIADEMFYTVAEIDDVMGDCGCKISAGLTITEEELDL